MTGGDSFPKSWYIRYERDPATGDTVYRPVLEKEGFFAPSTYVPHGEVFETWDEARLWIGGRSTKESWREVAVNVLLAACEALTEGAGPTAVRTILARYQDARESGCPEPKGVTDSQINPGDPMDGDYLADVLSGYAGAEAASTRRWA